MFVGRKEEGRAVLLSVRAGRGVVLSAPPGYGKTALLRELLPALEAWAPVVWVDRVAPFGAFLKDLFRGLWDAGVPVEGVGRGKDLEADLKAWGRRYPGNEEKARSLVKALRRPEGVNPITLVVDDATGITPSAVPLDGGLRRGLHPGPRRPPGDPAEGGHQAPLDAPGPGWTSRPSPPRRPGSWPET